MLTAHSCIEYFERRFHFVRLLQLIGVLCVHKLSVQGLVMFEGENTQKRASSIQLQPRGTMYMTVGSS